MKKSIKKIISLVIAMALTISGITYSTVAKADESEGSWKTDAVKVPSEGQLVGAGYIDVEFHDCGAKAHKVEGHSLKWGSCPQR